MMSLTEQLAASKMIRATASLLRLVDASTLSESESLIRAQCQEASDELHKLIPVPEDWVLFEDPEKTGVYRVRKIGTNSKQTGYAKWDGISWGMIFSRQKDARAYVQTRKRSSKFRIHWLRSSTPKGT